MKSTIMRDAVLGAIRTFHASHGYAPSIGDLVAAAGINRSTVHHHLRILRREGKIAWTKGASRTITVIEENPEHV